MKQINFLLNKIDRFYKLAINHDFDIKEFDSLPSFVNRTINFNILPSDSGNNNRRLSLERHKYLSKLQKIGEGTTRSTYILSPKKAIKVADDIYGIEQNKIEYRILSSLSSDLLPKVYDRSDNYSWIIVELVRPLYNEDEIKNLTGIDGEDFLTIMLARNKFDSFKDLINNRIKHYEDTVEDIKDPNYGWNVPEQHKLEYANEINNIINRFKFYLNNHILDKIEKFIKQTNVNPWEFGHLQNLGKSISNNLVLLDVGKVLG